MSIVNHPAPSWPFDSHAFVTHLFNRPLGDWLCKALPSASSMRRYLLPIVPACADFGVSKKKKKQRFWYGLMVPGFHLAFPIYKKGHVLIINITLKLVPTPHLIVEHIEAQHSQHGSQAFGLEKWWKGCLTFDVKMFVKILKLSETYYI